MEILAYCKEVAERIHSFEASAKIALQEENNEKYKSLMLQKAQLLASLEDEMKTKDYTKVGEKAQLYVSLRLPAFAKSAKTALDLNSTWYMSQLLYDTDYIEGEANNFDLFVKELEGF